MGIRSFFSLVLVLSFLSFGIKADVVNVDPYWAVELTGADLAKEILRSENLKPVEIVVSDDSVRTGARETLDLGLPRYQPDTLPLGDLAKIIGHQFIKDPKVVKSFDKWAETLPNEVVAWTELLKPAGNPFHGTHVAGIIGAEKFPLGISELAEITSIDLFRGGGVYYPAALEKELRFLLARDQNFAAVNMSHGLPDNNVTTHLLDQIPVLKNAACVIAAENDAKEISPMSPLGLLKNCTIVGSLSTTGTKSYFSRYGNQIDLVAPGDPILSRGNQFHYQNETVEWMSGTSMAAPMVTGAYANLAAILPEARTQDLKKILLGTAMDLGEKGKDKLTGAGLLNVFKATLVALRLKNLGIRSRAAIRWALKLKPIVFEVPESVLYFKTKRESLNPSSEEWFKALRAEILAEGKVERLKEIAKEIELKGYPDLAFGYRYLAINRPEIQLSSEDLSEFAKEVILREDHEELLTQKAGAPFLDKSLFQNLANSDLLLEIYSNLSPSKALLEADLFQTRLKTIAPQRENEWMALFARKKDEI